MATKLTGQTFDNVNENIHLLKQIFPEAFSEDKIIFEKLEELLGKDAMADKESYNFTRGGKKDAIKLALAQTTGTLRPDKASSKDWDTTQNLYIEGDNLEVLRALQDSYRNKIGMIYLDPPYNTGKDFVYKDNFVDNVASYKEKMNENMKSNPETNGRYHTDWLNMMYPRLKLARNLLKDDGVIFISIDDNEVANLRKICDEIFDEENFIASLPTVMNLKGNNDEFGFAGTHEYTIVFAKKIGALEELNGLALTEDDKLEYTLDDGLGLYKKGATLMRTGEAGAREKRPKGYYPIYVSSDLNRMSLKKEKTNDYEIYPQTKNGKQMSWRRSPETLMQSFNEFIITKSGDNISFNKKQRLAEDLINGKKPKTLFYKPEYSSGNGTEDLKSLFGGRFFDNPKPLSLIKDFIKIGFNEGIILDFFSGSATTAHAAMQLNSEDGGNRKFILVQIPEETEEKSEAQKAGYKNICEIGKERIRRAGEKVKEENKDKEGIDKLDIGFKCFMLDTTNLKKREPNPENINESLFNVVDALKEKRSQEDMLYEIMLKNSMYLTSPIETKTIDGKEVYIVAYGKLIVCLATDLSLTTIQSLIALEPADMKELGTRSTIILYDKGFDGDVTKLNALKQIEHAGLECMVI